METSRSLKEDTNVKDTLIKRSSYVLLRNEVRYSWGESYMQPVTMDRYRHTEEAVRDFKRFVEYWLIGTDSVRKKRA